MMTVVSSAKRIENKMLNALKRSFINTIKKRGPKIESWSTPCVINFVSDLLLLHNNLRSIR